MYFVSCWVGMCHRDTKTLTLTAGPHIHSAYTMGVQPPGFGVFCIRESGALFCTLEVSEYLIPQEYT